MRDRALEATGDVDLAEGEHALGQEVQVRHLGDQHGAAYRRVRRPARPVARNLLK